MARSLTTPAEWLGISAAALSVFAWVGADWPMAVRVSICAALLVPVAVHWMLPHEGKGLWLLFFALWGAIQGTVVGAIIATAFFVEPVYKAVSHEVGRTVIDSFVPTGDHVITPAGWVIAVACAGLGAVIGLYARYREAANPSDERVVNNRLIFAALGLLAVVGAGASAYGYKHHERGEDGLRQANELREQIKKAQEPKNPPAPDAAGQPVVLDGSSASMTMANDAVKSAEKAVQFGTLVFYVGIGVTCVAVLASVLYASYVIRLRQPPAPV